MSMDMSQMMEIWWQEVEERKKAKNNVDKRNTDVEEKRCKEGVLKNNGFYTCLLSSPRLRLPSRLRDYSLLSP